MRETERTEERWVRQWGGLWGGCGVAVTEPSSALVGPCCCHGNWVSAAAVSTGCNEWMCDRCMRRRCGKRDKKMVKRESVFYGCVTMAMWSSDRGSPQLVHTQSYTNLHSHFDTTSSCKATPQSLKHSGLHNLIQSTVGWPYSSFHRRGHLTKGAVQYSPLYSQIFFLTHLLHFCVPRRSYEPLDQ